MVPLSFFHYKTGEMDREKEALQIYMFNMQALLKG